jgi:hypothetical protein
MKGALCAEPVRQPRGAGLQIGLGGWSCRLTSDTSAGTEALARWFGRYRTPGTLATEREIRLVLRNPELPEIRISDADGCYDFSDLAQGPEWKRFRSTPDASRRLLADTLLGTEPVLELAPQATRVLQPRLWPLYVSVAWQWLMLRERSLCYLHAAVVAHRGQALALIGTSGAGKSTLALALQAAGADYFGDDGAYFDLPGLRLHPLPRDLCLRSGGIELLGANVGEGSWHELKAGDPKYVVRPERPTRPCPPGEVRLVFLNGFAEQPELAPISGGKASGLLFRQLAYGSPAIAERLTVVAALANRYPCYHLTIGPPHETATLLLQHVGND